MAGDREYTACCGLYCRDCIPGYQPLFDAAEGLKRMLENTQFEHYAEFKSAGNKTFDSFGAFMEVLDAVIALRCAKPCPNGGGKPDCPIRACARRQGLEGCWRCATFETCRLLEPLSAGHGDTPKHNLRLIKEHGVEDWADERGRHYIWQRPD